MGSEIKSRGKIVKEIDVRNQESDKRRKSMEKDVKDKKTVRDVGKGIKLNVTSEGMKAIKEGTQKAARETEKNFEKKHQALKKEVFEKDKTAEKVLKTQSDQTKNDMARMKQAAGRLEGKDAKQQMEQTGKAAGQEVQFFDKQHERQQSDRKKGEADAKKKNQELKGTNISFSR